MRRILNVGVLGSGSFGTALATMSARAGHNVKIFSKNETTIRQINQFNKNLRFFPTEIDLPKNISASNNLGEIMQNVDIIIHAIPVQSSFDFIQQNLEYFPEGVPYVIASKGILLKQKKFFSQAWDEIFKGKKLPHVVLSGPSFAIEMMKKHPTLVTLGSKDEEASKLVGLGMGHTEFKMYTTTDVIGVEIGGALKNPLAIGAGIIEGMGLGFNTSTAFVTRGIYELSLFSQRYGGKSETLFGLSGIGDVMLTCLGSLSRNKAVGIKIAKGESIEEIIANSKEVAEGIPTLQVLNEIIDRDNLDLPVMKTLYKLVFEKLSAAEAKEELMTSVTVSEMGKTLK